MCSRLSAQSSEEGDDKVEGELNPTDQAPSLKSLRASTMGIQCLENGVAAGGDGWSSSSFSQVVMVAWKWMASKDAKDRLL
jgi:hypothetical protein